MSEETKTAQKTTGKPFEKGDPRINRGGRPRMSEAERTMLGDAAPLAIKALVDALQANKSAQYEGTVIESTVPDHEVRKGAARELLDRRYGKPVQSIAGEDGGPIEIANVDLTTLSDAQFAALVALRDALKAQGD